MKLKTRIQLYSTVWIILLLIGANTVVYVLFYQFASNSEIERVASQAAAAAETLHTGESAGENISQILRAYVPAHGMIRIISNENNVLQTVTKESRFTELPHQYQTTESASHFQGEDRDHFALVHRPVIWNDGSVVTLQVTEHLQAFERNMEMLRLVLFVASLIILLPTLFGGRLLGNLFLRPIRELVATMNDVRHNGEWKKIDLHRKSKDEMYEMGSAFNHMIDRLSANFEKQRDFVSDASHELRTPLSIIDSYARLLKRWGTKKPEVLEESIEAILTETERMKKISEQLLVLARSDEEDILQRKMFNITEVCEKAVHSFSSSFHRQIHLDHPPKEIWMNGDEEKVKQVVYILLDNALKYSDKAVLVLLREDEDEVSLSVRDEGEGIPLHDQEHIFDRFYRVDKARSRATGGSGLGLAIASEIIRLHKGKITLHSTPGEGATFTMTLPKAIS